MESQSAAKRLKMSQVRFECVVPDEWIAPVPLQEVYVVPITDAKRISKAIIDLNAKLAVTHLQHLKRIKGRDILLFPLSWSPNALCVLREKSVDLDYFAVERIRTVQVPSHAPRTRQQHQTANKMWPCNFHSDKYVEKLVNNEMFSSLEEELHVKMLTLAEKLRKHAGSKCGVIITDPHRNNVIIAGGVSFASRNPVLHAPMIAIDNVAKSQGGGAYKELGNDEFSSIPWQSLLVDEHAEFKVLLKGRNMSENEYLCTNYNVYMTHEACLMCAMALVHSRVKRVFYLRSSAAGALRTTCKIHTVKSLNHHYEVFRLIDTND